MPSTRNSKPCTRGQEETTNLRNQRPLLIRLPTLRRHRRRPHRRRPRPNQLHLPHRLVLLPARARHLLDLLQLDAEPLRAGALGAGLDVDGAGEVGVRAEEDGEAHERVGGRGREDGGRGGRDAGEAGEVVAMTGRSESSGKQKVDGAKIGFSKHRSHGTNEELSEAVNSQLGLVGSRPTAA